MAVDANKWLHVPEKVPSIYDVDVQAVDEMGSWVRVRRRVVPKTTIAGAFQSHPQGRICGKLGNECYIREVALLPKWMQGRLAVLRIADPDVWIRNVGQRWGNQIKGGSPWGTGSPQDGWRRTDDDGYRWYTLDVGCEGVE